MSVFKRRKPEEPATTFAKFQPGQHSPEYRAAESEGLPAQNAGLGVPPFRPSPSRPVSIPGAQPALKESVAMGRSPFSPAPQAPQGVPNLAPNLSAPPRPVGPPSPGMPGIQSSVPVSTAARREPTERRTLVVGRGISLQGVVQDAERLVVEGTIEATMIHATELAVLQGGVFKGEVEVEDAEVAGTVDGTLTARGNLIVRATGRLLGTGRCRRLQVEDGGQITGRMEMLTDTVRAVEPARTEAAAD